MRSGLGAFRLASPGQHDVERAPPAVPGLGRCAGRDDLSQGRLPEPLGQAVAQAGDAIGRVVALTVDDQNAGLSGLGCREQFRVDSSPGRGQVCAVEVDFPGAVEMAAPQLVEFSRPHR